MKTRNRAWLVAGLAAVVIVMAACAPPPPEPATGTSPNEADRAGEAAYTEPGPYAAGVTTLDLSDRKVEVWYPADPGGIGTTPKDVYFLKDELTQQFKDLLGDVNPPFETEAYRGVPASNEGPFPLVVFSHGFASYRQQSSFLTAHLASWGFVVISPDYLERGLKSVLGEPPANGRPDTVVAGEAIDAVKAADATPGGLLDGVVDSHLVYPVGHSAGGGTSLRLLSRPDVVSAIPMAAGISLLSVINGTAPPLPADKAIMWMGAREDNVANIDDVRNGFQYTPGQRKLVELAGSGHNTFDDICEIGGGGAIALAQQLGLPIPDFLATLGSDGCISPPYREVREVWPTIDHFVTAELRYRSGLDPEPVGLGSQVVSNFDTVAEYVHNP